MSKQKKNSNRKINTEKITNQFIALCAALLILFSLHSGGEPLGLLMVLILLYASYNLLRHSFSEISLEKIFFLAIGLYFTFISIFGIGLTFFGMNLSVKNFLMLALLLLAFSTVFASNRRKCKITVEWKRFALIMGSFLIAFFIYLWPSLPSFTSPCTCGFDCTLHIDQSGTIYTMEAVAPPVLEWRFYPAGYHLNVAMLTHALEPNMPSYSNMIYPLTAFISALAVGMLCGMLYDRVKNKLYVLLLLAAIMTSVYPASALAGFGFWANIFGIYYSILFAWGVLEFVQNPKNKAIVAILVLTAFGSVLGYQLLTSMTLILTFIVAAMTLTKQKFMERVKTTLTFLAIFGLLSGVFLIEEYSKFLVYSTSPMPTRDYFKAKMPDQVGLLDVGRLDIKLNGTMFQVKSTGIHVEDLYAPPGVKISKLLSDGLKMEYINDFRNMARVNIAGPSGATLFFDLKWFGFLTLLLMFVGLVYSYSNRDYTLSYVEGSIIHLFIFSVGMKMGEVNYYYYSKMMYLFIYPMTLYAVVGVEELLSKMTPTKKILAVAMVAMLLMVAYSMNLLTKENVVMLIGERNDLYEQPGLYWPLLEFNRFQRYWDLAWGIKRDSYGLVPWLKAYNITFPFLTETNQTQEEA